MFDDRDKAEAKYYFLRDNPDALVGTGHDPEVAEMIRRMVRDDDLPMAAILQRIVRSDSVTYYFGVLFDEIGGDKSTRFELLDALVKARRQTWLSETLDAKMVGKKFNQPGDFAHLVQEHKKALLNRHEDDKPPFLHFIDPDPYWFAQVVDRIARPDYRRAWDELKKAQRGFFIGTREELLKMNRECRQSRGNRLEYNASLYRHSATRGMWVGLTLRLFEAMVKARIFTHQTTVPEDAFKAMDRHFRSERDARRRAKLGQAAVCAE